MNLQRLTKLKGVFAKNERGFSLNAIKKRFWSILILLISIASIRRKLLKTTNTEERSIHTNSERCNIRLRPWKNLFNFKQIIQILHPMVIDYLSPHLYIVDLSKYVLILFFKITFNFQLVFEHSWKIWKCRLHCQKSSKQE